MCLHPLTLFTSALHLLAKTWELGVCRNRENLMASYSMDALSRAGRCAEVNCVTLLSDGVQCVTLFTARELEQGFCWEGVMGTAGTRSAMELRIWSRTCVAVQLGSQHFKYAATREATLRAGGLLLLPFTCSHTHVML